MKIASMTLARCQIRHYNKTMLQHPFEVLLVEDNPGDIRLTREAFRRLKVPTNLSVVEDGEQALAFLRRQGSYEGVPRPDLVLLDLNLPRLSGIEVLMAIKNDAGLKRIPVVILTTSRSPNDIARSYDLYANCYVIKPVDLDRFRTAIEAIEDFWLSLVQLPPVEELGRSTH